MSKKALFILTSISLILILTPTTAQVFNNFDNSGSGSWKEYMSFPITTVPTEYAQYKIVINGNTWEIYNATGSLEISGTNSNFWSLVQSDGDDIRIFNQSAQLYFWIEYFNATEQKATIWVKLTANSTELNIAYGNPNALPSTYNNATLTFEAFDDFSSDLSKWTQNRGTWGITTDKKLTVVTDAGSAPGNVITYNGLTADKPLVVQADVTLSGEDGFAIYASSTDAYFLVADTSTGALKILRYTGVWSTLTSTTQTYTAGTTITLQLIIDGTNMVLKDLTNNIQIQTTFSFNTSYTIGFRASVGSTAKFDNFKALKFADPANFGTPIIISPTQKKFGTKMVYINVTYLDTAITNRYNPISYYMLEDKPQINVTSQLSVSGVNATYGANITIELINFVTLDKVIYNGTDITATLTYQGTITNATTGYTYNIYNFTTYENGTLEIYGHVANKAYEANYKLDGEFVDIFNITAVIGEPLEIILTYKGNVTIASAEYIGVTSVLVNTKDIGVGAKVLAITIEDPENFTVGYKKGVINIAYGSINVLVRHKDLTPFTNAIVSVFNENYSILSTDLNKLYAGNNTISVFFHGVKLKSVSFYLNHSTTGASITIDVNSTRFTDYRGVNKTIASPNSFEVVNLSAEYPYSVIEIRNYSGTVIIDYEANPPTAVDVKGADFVEYIAPVLKFSGSGNATVTDLYKLTVTIKDRLGNPVNFYVTVNGSRVDASKGIVAKLLKPSWYEVVAPITVNGFELWRFNDSSNVALVEVNTSDVTLPTAEYRVPTAIETKEVRIESLFGWLPIPFLSPKQDENVTIVRLEGTLNDFYGAPVANKTIKIEVASPKFTRVYNITTDSSGYFKLEVDMAKGVEYKVTYIFEGNDVYVGTSTTKTFYVESLLPAPPAPTEPLLIVFIIAAIGAGVVAIIYMAKKRTAVARTRIEEEFRFFRRLK